MKWKLLCKAFSAHLDISLRHLKPRSKITFAGLLMFFWKYSSIRTPRSYFPILNEPRVSWISEISILRVMEAHCFLSFSETQAQAMNQWHHHSWATHCYSSASNMTIVVLETLGHIPSFPAMLLDIADPDAPTTRPGAKPMVFPLHIPTCSSSWLPCFY